MRALHVHAARLGGDFTGESQDGPLSLTSLRGQVIPAYFDIISCPDLCPTTLVKVTASLEAVGGQRAGL